MIKHMKCLLIGLIFSLFPLLSNAQPNELRIAVGQFGPPFVMQGANNQLFGFDIAMVQSLCKIMGMTCRLYPMHFVDILNAVSQNQVDMGLDAITITQERMKSMLFSNPYLHPQISFLGLSTFTTQPFDISMLNGKRIGMLSGTVFSDVLTTLNIQNAKIKTYPHTQNVIDAIQNKDIDIAILDAQAAWYWKAQTTGVMQTYGQPLEYGAGLGIAISPQQPDLVPLVNAALKQYLQSPEFQQQAASYLYHF